VEALLLTRLHAGDVGGFGRALYLNNETGLQALYSSSIPGSRYFASTKAAT